MAEMYVLPRISELGVVKVVDAGIPNRERVYIKAETEVNLGPYFLTNGWRIAPENAVPLNSDVFWLGNITVAQGTWIVVYTGAGQQKVTRMKNGEPGLVLHWGRPVTIFNAPEIVPILLRIDGVRVGDHFEQKALDA